MQFKDNVPIYLQIKEFVYRQLVTGAWPPGEKLPSIRELAVKLSVNTNTAQRAMSELIDEGAIKTQRGLGNFVTEDTELIAGLKRHLVESQLAEFVKMLRQLGLNDQDIVAAVKNHLEEKNNG